LQVTWCDANAVGPNVWNDWKNALLWELYDKTLEILEKKISYEEIHRRGIEEKREKLKAVLQVELGKERAEFHMKRFSDYYLMATAIDDMVRHIKLS